MQSDDYNNIDDHQHEFADLDTNVDDEANYNRDDLLVFKAPPPTTTTTTTTATTPAISRSKRLSVASTACVATKKEDAFDERRRRQTLQCRKRLDALCDMTLVFLHSVLYKSGYYDKRTHFRKQLKYNIVVYVRTYSNYINKNIRHR